jgi:hypothetical protein
MQRSPRMSHEPDNSFASTNSGEVGGVGVDRVVGCARCGAAGTSTAVIGLGVAYAYLDVCDEHLIELLRNARPRDTDTEEPTSWRAADAPGD